MELDLDKNSNVRAWTTKEEIMWRGWPVEVREWPSKPRVAASGSEFHPPLLCSHTVPIFTNKIWTCTVLWTYGNFYLLLVNFFWNFSYLFNQEIYFHAYCVQSNVCVRKANRAFSLPRGGFPAQMRSLSLSPVLWSRPYLQAGGGQHEYGLCRIQNIGHLS